MEKSILYIVLAAVVVLMLLLFVSLFVFNPLDLFLDDSEEDSIDQTLESNQPVLQKIKKFRMKRLLKQRDLILRKENFTHVSNYQKYVTPNNATVVQYKDSNDIDSTLKAYDTAVDWTWVSDSTLHGRPEKWLMPAEFISGTPNYASNPVNGMASDCESQAYTLVSILEAVGVAKTNVRVVVGEVDFSGEVGGHAWVQVYQNGKWFELEATSGPYWDDDDQKLVSNSGFSFDYFKTHDYPVVEYWAFFNDLHFYNPDNGKESQGLPNHWKTS
jgi:hypothetical protein